MQIKLRKDKLAELSTKKKFEEYIESFGSTCGYSVKNPGAPHLYEVNKNEERLDTEKAKIFHSVAANTLYVTKRTRPDL